MAALPPSNLYKDLETSIATLAVLFSDQTLFNKPHGSELLKWHTNHIKTLFDKSHLSATVHAQITKTLQEHTVVILKDKKDLDRIIEQERKILQIIKQSNEPFQAVQEQRVEERKEPLPEHLQPAKQQLPETEAQEKITYDLAENFKNLLETALYTSETKEKMNLIDKIEDTLSKLHGNKIIKDNSLLSRAFDEAENYYNLWLNGRIETSELQQTLLERCATLIDEAKPGHPEAHNEMDKLRKNLQVLIDSYSGEKQINKEQIETAKQEINNCYDKLISNTYLKDKSKEFLSLQKIQYARMLKLDKFNTNTLETLIRNTIQKFPNL
jgi:hypothetical protein